jgi:hypothetical protein
MVEVIKYHHEYQCDKCGFKMEIESIEKDIKNINQEAEGIPSKCFRPKCGGNINPRIISKEQARLEGLRKANAEASAEAYKLASMAEQANPNPMVAVSDPDGRKSPEQIPQKTLDSLESKVTPLLTNLEEDDR